MVLGTLAKRFANQKAFAPASPAHLVQPFHSTCLVQLHRSLRNFVLDLKALTFTTRDFSIQQREIEPRAMTGTHQKHSFTALHKFHGYSSSPLALYCATSITPTSRFHAGHTVSNHSLKSSRHNMYIYPPLASVTNKGVSAKGELWQKRGSLVWCFEMHVP